MISLTRSGLLAMFLPTSALTAKLSIPFAAAFFAICVRQQKANAAAK